MLNLYLEQNSSSRDERLHRDCAGVAALALKHHVIDLAQSREAAQGEENVLYNILKLLLDVRKDLPKF